MSFMAALSQGMPNVSQMAASSMTGAQSYMSRVPSLPDNMYGSGQLYPQTSSGTGAPTHAMTSSRDSLKAASSLGHGQHYYVDHMMNPHPYSSLYPGFDMSAVRRKNATRETTGPLKAWLSGHRKNPYPTKGEKVMLAIATRMTLTQVSTWFANARRRMKKDNLSEDEEQDDSKDGADVRARSGSLSSRVSQSSSEADSSKDSDISKDLDISDHEDITVATRPVKKCVQRLFSPDYRTDHVSEPSSSPESLSVRLGDPDENCNRLPPVSDMIMSRQTLVKPQPVNGFTGLSQHVQENHATASTATSQKPKIWSISEIINGSANNTAPAAETTLTTQNHPDNYSTSTEYPTHQSGAYLSNYAYNAYANDYANYMAYHNMTYGTYASHGQQSQNSHLQNNEPVQYL